MKIDKAIRVLESEVKCWRLHPEEAYPKALKLGIEALKRFKRIQEDYPFAHNWKLSGETEE